MRTITSHHDCLYESHLRLFEDRFGWEVYRPTGIEWAREGLWRYSENPDVQRQFLEPWPGQELIPATPDRPEHYAAFEVHHPDRSHKLVTVEQFRAIEWDYILASVTQHEKPWQELADKLGAQAVLQVGNVGQPVDWGLSHKVLAAARIDLQPGRGVIYHPEFDAREYRHEPTSNPRRITSFMNCLPDAGPAYDDWQALQAELPDYEFREYGILGRDGILGPSGAVGDEMREAGFAFHNKPQGDGYGFVIHQWGSVGRPLIGRRSYYYGKLAEGLWEDAIDLDQGIGAAAQLIRQADVAATGDRLARKFRSLVDWAAEAAVIRDYLG